MTTTHRLSRFPHLALALCSLATLAPGALAQAEASAPSPIPPAPAPAPGDMVPQFDAQELARFTVRPGYKVEVAIPVIPGSRFMEVGPDGTLYISRPREGDVIAAQDLNNDGLFETLIVWLDGLPSVHGLSWHGASLYVATSGGIFRATDTDGNFSADDVVQLISDLPEGGMHWWRSLWVTDQFIYTGIGDSGNITDESATDRQKIWRFNLDGSGKTLFASGVRNTEKLRYRPGTTELWGVDHGSDRMGLPWGENEDTGQPITDENPPDELNHYTEGGFYGHPFLVGTRVPRLEFRERPDLLELASRTIIPEWSFPAHSAANSFTFIDPTINRITSGFPEDHGGDMFVACRGAWNRSTPAGYSVKRVLFDRVTGKPYGALTIVSTIVPDGSGSWTVLARPVDCIHMPDGSILFSSDVPAGRIYRIRWTGQAELPAAPEEK